jgi:hypothetical protein
VLGLTAPAIWRSAVAALFISSWGGTAMAQAVREAPDADASASGLALTWTAPADCQRGAAVRAKVLRLLGSRRAALVAVEVSVTVERQAPSRFVALLETTTARGGGSKRLEGESCEAIALASSVVIALSIDPEASLDAEPATPEQPRPAPPPRPTPPPRKPSAAPRPRETRETKPYLHASIGVLFGLLGDPSAFTAAGVGVRHRRLALELSGAVYQPRDVTRADRPKVGAELQLFSAELWSCYAAIPFALGALEVCPGGKLEYLRARAFGVSNPDEGGVLILAGVAALRGRLHPTSWLSGTLDVGVAARPFHPTFVLLGVGDVYEIPVFSPFARTGLAVEF